MKKYSLKKGMKNSPKKGADAFIKETTQLHKCGATDPLVYGSLTYGQKREALILLIFLKEKQGRLIKGGACADESWQRTNIKKEDTTSPSVAMESYS